MEGSLRKNLVIFLSVVLIASFFMSWINFLGLGISAWDLVFGNVGKMINSPLRFIVVLIPLSALGIVSFAVSNDEKHSIGIATIKWTFG